MAGSRSDVILQQDVVADLDAGLLNLNWLRWIKASICTHFDDYKDDFLLYIEGDERDTANQQNFAELRADGPLVQIPHKGLIYLDYDINVLLQSHIDKSDLYVLERITGTFLRAFTQRIPVYKYGTGELDDQSLIGCLKLHHTKYAANRGIEVNMYGIVHQETRLAQSTIEGHYRIQLEDERVF